MKETFFAPAKLNLYLKVVGKRDDGYHLLESIMHTVNLYDIIELQINDGDDIIIECDDNNIPCDKTNIVYKCAEEVFKYVNYRKSLKINIKKRIPFGAGMGGGSADGAAIIKGLNKMLSLNLSLEEMIKIGKKVGADIPFMILGKTAKVEGIGERVKEVSNIKDAFFVVVKPDIVISTKEAYKKIDDITLKTNNNFNNIIQSIESKNLINIAKYFENDFELVAPSEIFKIKNRMIELGAINSLMTGSGSAVFGMFDDEDSALRAKNEMMLVYDKVYILRSA